MGASRAGRDGALPGKAVTRFGGLSGQSAGMDVMTAGAGRDIFVFLDLGDSTRKHADPTTDLSNANVSGNQGRDRQGAARKTPRPPRSGLQDRRRAPIWVGSLPSPGTSHD